MEAHGRFRYSAVVITNPRPETAIAAIELARKLINSDRYIFVSSDLVYRPSNSIKSEDYYTEPVTQEGKLFLAAERLMDINNDTIFRAGYIVGLCSVNLYTNILNLARSNMRISLPRKTVRNFIRNTDISSFIMRSIEEGISGVFNTASDFGTAYDFAKRICDVAALGCKLYDSGEDLGNYSMDTSKSLRVFGIRPTSVFDGYSISGSFDLR